VRYDSVTIEGRCVGCGHSFPVRGRRRFCSNACRQRAHRQRRGAAAPAALPAQTAIVYECAACGDRLLNEQRCPECNTFCRRLGPGAPCPHCDELVALNDLS